MVINVVLGVNSPVQLTFGSKVKILLQCASSGGLLIKIYTVLPQQHLSIYCCEMSDFPSSAAKNRPTARQAEGLTRSRICAMSRKLKRKAVRCGQRL